MKEARELIRSLLQAGMTVAFAESVTCGLASHEMNSTKGSSETFMGSVVCYHEDVKSGLLGVSKVLLEKKSAESQEVTEAMAAGLKQVIRADIHAAITGLAAAGGSETEDKPVGTVFVAVLSKAGMVSVREVFSGTPQHIKKEACRLLFRTIMLSVDRQKEQHSQSHAAHAESQWQTAPLVSGRHDI